MGLYYETKHDAFNLKFKEHEVFKDKLVVVDESDIPVLWLDKQTGKVSFGGKYFHLYKEQRLLEVLMEFVYASANFVYRDSFGDKEDIDHTAQFKKALELFEGLPEDFKKN